MFKRMVLKAVLGEVWILENATKKRSGDLTHKFYKKMYKKKVEIPE
jgi:hypothetical protein